MEKIFWRHAVCLPVSISSNDIMKRITGIILILISLLSGMLEILVISVGLFFIFMIGGPYLLLRANSYIKYLFVKDDILSIVKIDKTNMEIMFNDIELVNISADWSGLPGDKRGFFYIKIKTKEGCFSFCSDYYIGMQNFVKILKLKLVQIHYDTDRTKKFFDL